MADRPTMGDVTSATKWTKDDEGSTKGDRAMKKLVQKIFGRSAAADRRAACDIGDATCQGYVGMMSHALGDAGRQIALNS
jgi:hypothetical protein